MDTIRRLLLLAACAAGMAGFGWCSTSWGFMPQQTSACPIVASPPGADFGIVAPGTTVSQTIQLFNPFDHPIRIVAATPSCTCTMVDMAGKSIPAKGTIDMPMSMKTARSVGKKAAQVALRFEGVATPLIVRIDAETAYAVRANPTYIDALAPERMAGFFELLSTDGTPFVVRTVDGKPARTADGTEMKPALRQVIKYDMRAPGLLSVVPPFLIVETDHPKCPVLDLRVRHETTRISPTLNFAEFRENIGVVENGKPIEFEVILKHATRKRLKPGTTVEESVPVAVDRIVPNHKEWTAELVGSKFDGDSLLVTVRLKPVGMPAGPFLFTCTLGAGAESSELWIYGSTR